LLAKTLARFVNVPFVIADATTLTQVGLFLIDALIIVIEKFAT
jgi:ATP-dependent protease Clp ATPase subunit